MPNPMSKNKPDVSNLKLKRDRQEEPEFPEEGPAAVSNGPIDRVIELAFNPSRDKIREVTIIDRLQGRLFPIMDAMNSLYRNCIEIASYRQSPELYKMLYRKEKPQAVDIMDDLMYRTAQWQKSVAGRNLDKATDIALAETETRGDGDLGDGSGAGRGYED